MDTDLCKKASEVLEQLCAVSVQSCVSLAELALKVINEMHGGLRASTAGENRAS